MRRNQADHLEIQGHRVGDVPSSRNDLSCQSNVWWRSPLRTDLPERRVGVGVPRSRHLNRRVRRAPGFRSDSAVGRSRILSENACGTVRRHTGVLVGRRFIAG